MFSLIEKFYSSSPVKRLLTVVTWLLIIAAASSAYSFINLYRIGTEEMNRERYSKQVVGFENLPAKLKLTYLDDRTKASLASWKNLKDFSAKLLKETPTFSQVSPLDASIASYDAQIIETVKTFNDLDWKYLSLFASRQLDPLDDSLEENFRQIRNVAKFLEAFQTRFKELYPQESSAFLLEASLKLARMTDLSCPYLVGKLIAVAVDKSAVHTVHALLEAGKITPEEAKQCLSAVKTSLELDRPLAMNIENEFVWFKYSYSYLFSRNAPLATWLLDTFFGDPIVEYQSLYKKMLEGADPAMVMKSIRHPALHLGFPNFGNILLGHSKSLALKAILESELNAATGYATPAIDPFSDQPLKVLTRDGKPAYYSVGPNKTDDGGRGDDVSFFAD